ncbi:MAG TPA: hypothetical protein VJV78_07885 [Polyangiales bacterium]|nr:hypothetical protein [Polyangiales bacterium]
MAIPSSSGAAGSAPVAAGGVTFHKDIRPIMADNCSMACHGPDAATRTGPVALDTYASVKMVGALVVNAVTTNRMPPWPADPNCHPLRDAPSITAAQRDLFKQWQAAGFPEGNPSDYVPPPADVNDELGPPTRTITFQAPHTPPPNTDEYACARSDFTFAKDTYVRAIEVIPDQKAEVHHVQMHLVSNPVCTTGDNIYSWRPGGRRLVFSDGDAALIKAGQTFNFQMHYNTIGKQPTADKTRVALWELPDGMKPKKVVTRVGVFGLTPVLTPGAVQSVTATMAVGGAGTEIIGVSPHAHMIAKTMTANLMHGGKAECLTNVPDWKFEWQMDYLFKDPIPLATGDTVQATCGYDNSASHQPTVDGVKRAQPITVGPGEGTSDEMCLHYVWLRRPVQ